MDDAAKEDQLYRPADPIRVFFSMLAEYVNYLLLLALQMLVFTDLFGLQPGLVRLLLPGLVPVCFYLVREYCSNRLLFFLLHVAPIAGAVTLYGRNPFEKVIWGLLLLLYAITSMARKLNGQKNGVDALHPAAAAGFLFALYLLDRGQWQGAVGGSLMNLLVFYLVGFLLLFYGRHFLGYMEVNSRTTEHIPVQRAFKSSAVLVLGGLLLLTGILFLIANRELLDAFGSMLRRAVVSVISFLFSLLPEGENTAVEIQQTEAAAGGQMELPAGETSWLTEVFNVLFYILGIAAVVVMAAVILTQLVRFLMRTFQSGSRLSIRHSSGEDKVEFLMREGVREKKDRKKTPFRLYRTPAETIRRQYQKTMYRKYLLRKEEKVGQLLLRGTALECCEALFSEKEEESMRFADLYEKARYGQESIQREEVSEMKRLSGELLK